MSKLTKAQAKAHAEAVALLTKDRLTEDERWFVLENWREDANHINSTAGAFFTPVGLARDFSLETGGCRTFIDLCAGIGALSFMTLNRSGWGRDVDRIVCIEANPDYAAAGRKVLPEAEWIVADIFDLPEGLGHFEMALSNPPFGAVKRSGKAPRYTGPAFEYHVIDIASDLADFGAFILPQMSAPFRYSGAQCYRREESDAYQRFADQTSLRLDAGCGIDTSVYQREWRGTAPVTEIVTCDFTEKQAVPEKVAPTVALVPVPAEAPAVSAPQLDLFGQAA